MENADEFERWLERMLHDAREKLAVTDETIAWVLLREGTAAYFRSMNKCARCPLKIKIAK